MAKTRAEVDKRIVELTEAENPIMHLRVRKKGAGKISTGVHDPRGGDLLYDEGETFSVALDVAQPLLDLDYVDEVALGDVLAILQPPAKPAPKADDK